MTPSLKTAARGAAVAAALALAAGAAPAAAQIPGGDTAGFVVNVDDPSLVVVVNDKGDDPTVVTGTIENTTGVSFRCEVPRFDIDGTNTDLGYGQVTTAAAASEVKEYYRTRVFTGPADINVSDNLVSLGSVYEMFPSGSAVGSAEADTRNAHNEARVAGRMGDPRVGGALQFTVNAGATVDYSAALGDAATGDRGEWRAAAVFMCKNNDTNEWYLYTGLEDIDDPNVEAVEGEDSFTMPDLSGSLSGSLDAGSLGS